MQRGRVLGAPLWARVFKKIPVNKGGGKSGKSDKSDKKNRGNKNPVFPVFLVFPVLPVFPKSDRCQPLLFLCATKLRKVLCHFWWQKWRKSHAPHLWRRRESQSLKRMLRRQSVCRLRFLTALRLSSVATDKSVAYPPTMRSAGFRCALVGAGVKKDTREQGGGKSDGSGRSDKKNRRNRRNRNHCTSYLSCSSCFSSRERRACEGGSLKSKNA